MSESPKDATIVLKMTKEEKWRIIQLSREQGNPSKMPVWTSSSTNATKHESNKLASPIH